jgi:hypothetical protein
MARLNKRIGTTLSQQRHRKNVTDERSSAVSNISRLSDYRVQTQYSAAGPILENSTKHQLSTKIEGAEKTTGLAPMATESDLRDAEIAAAEARTDTKIARMEGSINTALATITGKIDALSGQVSDQRRDRNLIIGTIVVAAIALGGMLWGMATYGDALFGRGMNVRDVVSAVIKEQQSQTPPQTPSKN